MGKANKKLNNEFERSYQREVKRIAFLNLIDKLDDDEKYFIVVPKKDPARGHSLTGKNWKLYFEL